MRKSINIFLILLISIFINPANALPIDNDKVSKVIKQLMKKDHISGVAVAFIDHGKKTIYVFGKTNHGKSKPITDNTLFELGSITKLFTTLMLSEEIQNRQMTLTNSITDYLPQFSRNSNIKQINLGELATHTSGLPFDAPPSIKTKFQLNRYLLQWKPKIHSEITWQYSNMAMGLLGSVLSVQNHTSIQQLFENNIFTPLNMTESSLLTRSDTQHLLGLFPAAWALQSNITDMSYFLAAAIELPDTPKNILLAMQFAQTPRIQTGNMKQALAWQVYSLNDKQKLLDTSQYMNLLKTFPMKILPANQQYYDPNTLIDKTGSTNGFRSYIAVIPSQKSGIVILINTLIPHSDIVYAGRKILLDVA